MEHPLLNLWGAFVTALRSAAAAVLPPTPTSNSPRGWAEQGFTRVKMKIGTYPADDPRRVGVIHKAIGSQTELFVDADGGYTMTQALEKAHMEYFRNHPRMERLFFDGFREPVKGVMYPDLSRPGMGLELKEGDAAPFLV